MLEQYKTIVWDANTSYRIPLKKGNVVGNKIIIESRNHWLQTGDIVNVQASVGYEAFGATDVAITKEGEDSFSYTVSSPPGTFPNPRPGLPIILWLTSNRYSTMMSAPERVRISVIPSGTMIQVQTRNDDLSWTNQKSLSNSGGIIDLTFTQVFKEVRFVRVSGDGVPLCTSLSTKAPSFVESFGTSPNNRYEIPEVVESGGGGPGGSNFTISDVPPSNPNVGDWWLNNSTGILYTWIDDGDTEVWVELGDSNGIGFGGEDEEDEASNEYGQAIMIGSGPSPIDSFSAVSYRSAKYQMQISDGTDYETCTVYLIHDGTEVYLSTYGNIFSNESMGEFDAELEDGTITISFTATVSNSKVIKFRRSLIDS